MQDVAFLDDGILAQLRVGCSLSLNFDARMEPRAQSEIVDLLSHPPDHVFGARDTRRDDGVRKRSIDDVPHHTLQVAIARRLFRQPRADEVERESIDVLELRRPLGTECLAHAVELTGREPVAEREHGADINVDRSWIALLDHALEHLPLLIAPQFGLSLLRSSRRAGWCLGRAHGREDTTL